MVSVNRVHVLAWLMLCFLTGLPRPCMGAENTEYTPYCISVTFNGDVQSCKGFAWYTDAACGSQLLLAELHPGCGNDFSQARLYQGNSMQEKRFTGRKAVVKQVTVHRAELTDLAADTSYVYKVGDAKRGIWSEPGRFHTASRQNGFSFMVVADSQAEDEADYTRISRILRQAFQTLPEADFLVHMGDFTEHYSSQGSFENFAEWQGLFAACQKELMDNTILPVAGNHDMSSQVFCNHFCLPKLIPDGADTETGAYYAVDYANTCFLVLNTNEGYEDGGTGMISQQQVEWLKNTAKLADRQGTVWKILLMHRAIYSFGRHMDHADIIGLRSQLAPLIDELGIDLVLQGHDHVYMRSMLLARSASGQVEAQPEPVQMISADFAAEKIDFAVNPRGTTYIIPNLIGDQFGFQKSVPGIEVYPQAVYQPDDNDEPVFAEIRIEGNRLLYRAYAYDPAGRGQISEIDRYAVLKDSRAEVRQQESLENRAEEFNRPVGILQLWQELLDYLSLHAAAFKW